jgi:acetyl-CoA carboxylase carboxyl transferase subunit beta
VAERIATLLDEGSFEELDPGLQSLDPLQFRAPDRVYVDKLAADREKTGLAEALLYGRGRLEGLAVVLAVPNFAFRGGTMGVVVGEKLTRAIELATREATPLIVVSASGGARMEEGVFSLMQMAKTTAALARLGEAMVPYISLLTDPTIGGVPASYAMLGDVNIAEPGAHIHFAGARVVEEALRQKGGPTLPTAEFMLRHGMIDLVVPRAELRPTIARLLRLYGAAPCHALRTRPAQSDVVAPAMVPASASNGSAAGAAVVGAGRMAARHEGA